MSLKVAQHFQSSEDASKEISISGSHHLPLIICLGYNQTGGDGEYVSGECQLLSDLRMITFSPQPHVSCVKP